MAARKAGQQVSNSFNIPAPVGGINARDAYTDMSPEDAVGLVNVFPEANYIAVRGGYSEHATNMVSPVRSLMVWRGNTDELFAGAGADIWAVTAAGVATSEVATLTNVDFQWTNLANSGGQHLIAVNGADDMLAYDGSAWTTPTITGATSADFVNVCQFKERLWFASVGSIDVHYLGLQAIAGAATRFPLGSVFRRGGYVIGLGTFSRDAGEGPDDFFVIITNNGEVAVYEGTNPDSAQTWALAGVFDVGKPIGRRSTVRLNGDLTIITQDGVVSAQALLQFDRASIQKAAITGKIQTLFSQFAQSYFPNFGWQNCVFPASRYMIVNVPAIPNMSQSQLVMNTITGAWCQFQGMNAGCWAVANNELFFGGNAGIVYQAANGFLDNGGTISWDVQTAWQMVGGAANKFFTMVKPTMLTGGGVAYSVSVNVDFQSLPLAPGAATIPVVGMIWGWTWPSNWGGTNLLNAQWRTVGAIGTWASIHIAGTVNGGACQINNFEVVAQRGGVL